MADVKMVIEILMKDPEDLDVQFNVLEDLVEHGCFGDIKKVIKIIAKSSMLTDLICIKDTPLDLFKEVYNYSFKGFVYNNLLLQYAALYNREDIIRYLYNEVGAQSKIDNIDIVLSSDCIYNKSLEYLVNYNLVDVNHYSEDKGYLFGYVIKYCRFIQDTTLIETLLKKGADITVDDYGFVKEMANCYTSLFSDVLVDIIRGKYKNTSSGISIDE